MDGSPDLTQPAPLVSVIVPAWNASASLERAVGSVLADRSVDLECLVVDDGSTDGTAEVARGLAARDGRVRLLVSPVNEGVSAARNRGLEAARGEWLTFLDADDRLVPGAIASLVRAASTTGALAVIGQRVWSDGESTWITRLYDQPDIRVPGRKSILRNPGLLFYASTTGKLFHRSCSTGLVFEGRVLGDQPWTVRALLRAGDRIQVIGDTVYEWTRPGRTNRFSSITARKQESAALAAEAVLVAIGAFRDVGEEARRLFPDPADRHAIEVAYLDRLVRADFAGPVRRALQSRDPAMATLFEALATFLATIPTGVLGHVPAVFTSLVQPPLLRWTRVPATARPAVTAVRREVLGRAGIRPAGGSGRRRYRVAVRLTSALPEPLALPMIALVAMVGAAARAMQARIGTRRHGGASPSDGGPARR